MRIQEKIKEIYEVELTGLIEELKSKTKGLAHIRLTEKQIENGVLKQDTYIEGAGEDVSAWQKAYDNWVEPALTENNVLSEVDENIREEDGDGLPF